jgi:hypothetical protein
LNADDDGHYDLYLTSDRLEKDRGLKGHSLPMFLRRKENENVNYFMRLRILALKNITLELRLHLLHRTQPWLVDLKACAELR